jgi:hypothetical protein
MVQDYVSRSVIRKLKALLVLDSRQRQVLLLVLVVAVSLRRPSSALAYPLGARDELGVVGEGCWLQAQR